MFGSSLLSMNNLSLYFIILTSQEYYDFGDVIIAAMADSVANTSATFSNANFLKILSSRVSTLKIWPVNGCSYTTFDVLHLSNSLLYGNISPHLITTLGGAILSGIVSFSSTVLWNSSIIGQSLLISIEASLNPPRFPYHF